MQCACIDDAVPVMLVCIVPFDLFIPSRKVCRDGTTFHSVDDFPPSSTEKQKGINKQT